jgi:hypothetical protein
MLGLMSINGLWRFGYYRLFSGKSMEDIPIGFNIKILDDDNLLNANKDDTNNIVSEQHDIDNLEDCTREFSSFSMRTLNPISTTGNTNEDIDCENNNNIISQHEVINQTSQERIRIAELESMLSEVLQFKSEKETQLNQTNVLLQECLNRLAQLEKSS